MRTPYLSVLILSSSLLACSTSDSVDDMPESDTGAIDSSTSDTKTPTDSSATDTSVSTDTGSTDTSTSDTSPSADTTSDAPTADTTDSATEDTSTADAAPETSTKKCTVDSDCRKKNVECGDPGTGCKCLALSPSEPDPVCASPTICLVEPCRGKTARCGADNTCVIDTGSGS